MIGNEREDVLEERIELIPAAWPVVGKSPSILATLHILPLQSVRHMTMQRMRKTSHKGEEL